MSRFASLFVFLLTICSIATKTSAQSYDALVGRFISQNLDKLGVTEADVQNLKKGDQYKSKHNGITHIYFIQYYQSLPIFGASLNVNIDENGKIIHWGNRLQTELESRINHHSPLLSPEETLSLIARYYRVEDNMSAPQLIKRPKNHEYLYSPSGISDENIALSLGYFPRGDKLHLCWNVHIHIVNSNDVWNTRIDAINGEVLHEYNMSLYCFGENEISANSNARYILEDISIPKLTYNTFSMIDPSYLVIPFPFENPNESGQQFVSDDVIEGPSPFGWHDTDGEEGPEFTTTRGNNVHSYLDENGDQSPDELMVDGGADLIFDYIFDPSKEPEDLREAGMINMFYVCNYMHDFSYLFGFDEAAGNYQENNYGNGGQDGDYIRAEGNDGDGENNSVFSVTGDGIRGKITMYKWTTPGPGKLRVEAPSNLEGHIFNTGDAESSEGFGPPITNVPVTGQLALANSGGSAPEEGCSTFINQAEMNGKIAVVRRGTCDFSLKVYNAQVAGAIGVIICNTQENLINIGAGEMASSVNIPVVSIRNSSCDTIMDILGSGVVSIVENPFDPPYQKSGMFDNGVIAHEYAHGISTRLTGGPNDPLCLTNDEQMGEGWSDFFLLAVTAKEADKGESPRGVGTYLIDDEFGIRRFPYSTDMGINPQTMNNIKNTSTPHQLGEVWAGVLWDLYWAMVDEYGFDPDLNNTESGNAKAIQLVMDGMKMQPCSPGFIDGRDAILAADLANNGGENECLIWNVFAPRGMGLDADQGDTDDRNDNTAAFNVPKQCESSSISNGFEEGYSLRIFPNPSDGQFTLEFVSDENQSIQISIISLDGKEIWSGYKTAKRGTNKFDIEQLLLPKGAYILCLQTEQAMQSKKLIIY